MSQDVQNSNITLQWLIPERVFLITVRGTLTDADSQHADEMLTHYLNQATKTVHVVLDVTYVSRMSGRLFHLRQTVLKHACTGWIITIGGQKNPILNFGITALSVKHKIRYRDWPTLPSALDFLQRVDATLPTLAATPSVMA